jgi:cell division protein FtsB
LEFVFEDKSSPGFSSSSRTATAEPMQMASNNTIFGSSMTQAPLSRRSRRSLPETVDDIELTGTRRKRSVKKTASSKVKYVSKPKRRSTATKFVWTWQKFWWMVAFVTLARLLFMENGVVDYYSLEATIEGKHEKLELVQNENAELVTEIHKIQTSRKYQKKVARDHLGVIASNEYLILFAKD